MAITSNEENEYYALYNELCEIALEITEWYDIDKTKPYGVYIWDKKRDYNQFDIYESELIFYKDCMGEYDYHIIEDAKPTINKIQNKLKEINQFVEANKKSV